MINQIINWLLLIIQWSKLILSLKINDGNLVIKN